MHRIKFYTRSYIYSIVVYWFCLTITLNGLPEHTRYMEKLENAKHMQKSEHKRHKVNPEKCDYLQSNQC